MTASLNLYSVPRLSISLIFFLLGFYLVFCLEHIFCLLFWLLVSFLWISQNSSLSSLQGVALYRRFFCLDYLCPTALASWLELEWVPSGQSLRTTGAQGQCGSTGQNMTRSWLHRRRGAPKAALLEAKGAGWILARGSPESTRTWSLPWIYPGAEAPGQRQLLGQYHLGSVAGARMNTD